MECLLCGHDKVYEHGTTSKGTKRYECPRCQKTFVETLDTIYYHRHIDAEKIHLVLQSQNEGVSQRGIARLTGLAYNTVVSIIRQASQKAQMIHNQEVKAVETPEVSSDEMWSFVEKNRRTVYQQKLSQGTVGLE
jgi:transposase-like protein